MKSFNSAWDEYEVDVNRTEDASHEEIAYRTDWNAVKRKYARDKRTGKWTEKK